MQALHSNKVFKLLLYLVHCSYILVRLVSIINFLHEALNSLYGYQSTLKPFLKFQFVLNRFEYGFVWIMLVFKANQNK